MDLQKIADELVALLSLYGLKVVAALAILLVGRWIAGIASSAIERGLLRRDIDPTIRQFIGKLVFALILVFTVVAALSNVGIQTASIIAALGAAGLAIGLALQGSLANFAAGVLLVLFRPCRVGDYIEAGGVAGTVQRINLFSTTLTTPDNRQVIVPNSGIMSGAITNYSAMSERRLDLRIGIAYDADIVRAKQELEQLLAADERVLSEPAAKIAVLELGPSSVNLVVRPWVRSEHFWDVHFDLTERIKLQFDKVGITIPFPQMDVHLHRPDSTQNRGST